MKMKRLFLLILIISGWSSLILALPDLAVQEIIIAEPGEPGAVMDLSILIQNIGAEVVKTRLPAQIYFDNDQSGGTYPLISLYVDTRIDKAVRAVEIVSADGSKIEQYPVKEKVSYLQPALSGEALDKKLLELEKRLELSAEEKVKALKEAEEFYSQEHNLEVEGWFITLQPEETAKLDSKVLSYTYPFEEVSSLESKTHHFNILLDPEGEIGEEKTFNNFLSKLFMVSPTILKGPLSKTSKSPALAEGEYFVTRLGCAELSGKTVCSKLNADSTWTVSVNSEEQTYDLYGLLMKWLNGLFSDGKLAAAQDLGGVEVTVYVNGYKISAI